MTVPRGDIVTQEKSATPIELYEEKSAKVPKDNASAHFELARWCREQKLPAQHRKHILEAGRLKPDLPGLPTEMAMLGYILVSGAWVDKNAHMKSQGLESEGGRYIPAEEAQRARESRTLQKDQTTTEQRIDAISKEYDQLGSDIQRKVGELRPLVIDFVQRREQLIDALKRKEAADAELANLQRMAQMNPNARARFQAEISAAQARSLKAQQESRSLERQLSDIDRKGTALIQELNTKNQRREQLLLENETLRSRQADIRNKLDPSATAREKEADANAVLNPETLFERAAPAVVRIEAVTPAGTVSGSGFFVDAEGTVVTNAHVIQNATSITVIRFGNRYPASGPPRVDAANDLARLQTGVKGATCLTISPRKPVVGEKVYAIGSPMGVFTNTLSDGMVSGIRPSESSLNDYVIQSSAPISPGCSGGPLLNAAGQVIGVNTATVRGGQNLNFAVSAVAVNALLGRRN
jgi:S1-C subfamily serine protease